VEGTVIKNSKSSFAVCFRARLSIFTIRQVITSSTIQTCKQQQRSAFSFLRDTVCGLVQSIFTTVTGASPSATAS
jgi:hypothetical protein